MHVVTKNVSIDCDEIRIDSGENEIFITDHPKFEMYVANNKHLGRPKGTHNHRIGRPKNKHIGRPRAGQETKVRKLTQMLKRAKKGKMRDFMQRAGMSESGYTLRRALEIANELGFSTTNMGKGRNGGWYIER